MSNIELYITGRERDLGGFFVRRVLPYPTHRMVGPFIFFDHMGPASFAEGKGIDVRPHPHIGLATVTFLFEGQAYHRDSLGSDQIITPGDINWMTAGRGIVHSERTPEDMKHATGDIHGIQCWVALPLEHEDAEPSFTHYPSKNLPEFQIDGAQLKLLIGSAFGHQSPVKTYSDLFYLDVKLPKGKKLNIPAEGREAAAYLVSGKLSVEDKTLEPFTMAVAQSGHGFTVTAEEDSHLMLLGGAPVGERFIFWNFVASSKERLEQAKKDWALGPQPQGRFKTVPGDEIEFIPLPADMSLPRK